MNTYFSEDNGMKVMAPVDCTGGLTGEVISLANTDSVAISLNFGTSTSATVAAALKQFDGTTTKALEIKSAYYIKKDAETVFTKVELNSDAIDLADLADVKGHVIIEVMASDLDHNNGFYGVSVNLTNGAIAKLVAVEYIAHQLRFKPGYKQGL
ncbi:MAG: hypothetical protein KAG61_03645 [Bacteriovoracaceae bacterium]|nr:hypothetical protein [Bacteriovoracaceae bacterium]